MTRPAATLALAIFFVAAPARAETPAPATVKAATVAFHFESEDAPLIVVPVTIDGQGPFQFVVDTGASMTVISRALAKKLKIARKDTARGLGAGGAVAFKIGEVGALSVGDARLEKLQVAIGDVGAIGPTDGILGFNFLREFRITIDYKAKTLALAP